MSVMSVAILPLAILLYLGVLVGLLVLCGLGLYRMAKNAGIPNPWLAFVPVGTGYILGLLAERSLYCYTGKRSRLALWNVLLSLAPLLLGVLLVFFLTGFSSTLTLSTAPLFALLFFACGLLYMVVHWYSFYYLFRDYSPENAVLFLVLSILLGIPFVFTLVVMNNVPVSVSGFGGFAYGRPRYDRNQQWSPNPPYNGGYNPGNHNTTNPGDPEL